MLSINDLIKATQGISIDSRTIKPGEAFIAIKGNNFDGHDFIDAAIEKGARAVVVQSTVHSPQSTEKTFFIKVKDTTKALGDIARFQRKRFNIPIIAVTGSNGKTTTKEMLACVLSKKFKVLKNEGTKNNQIGLPLALIGLNASYDIAVLEIGTNHFGEVEYLAKICQPNIGIITNVGPAHLEFLRDLEGVFREKYSLIENLKKPYITILNSDDNFLRKELLKKTKNPFTLGFGMKNKADFFASDIKCHSEKLEFLINQKYKFTLNTLGYFNIANALVAIVVARLFGIEYKDIAKALATFDFPQGRLKFRKLNNIRFIDDTYNSNPFSLKQALDTLHSFNNKGRKILVMGDMLELGNKNRLFHYQAGQQIARVCDKLITVGKLSKIAAHAAQKAGLNIEDMFTCESNSQARDILLNKISLNGDDIVLVKGSRLMKMEEVFKGHPFSQSKGCPQFTKTAKIGTPSRLAERVSLDWQKGCP